MKKHSRQIGQSLEANLLCDLSDQIQQLIELMGTLVSFNTTTTTTTT
jgi:hypothetical protein